MCNNRKFTMTVFPPTFKADGKSLKKLQNKKVNGENG